MFSVLVATIFFFNGTGVAGLAIASSLPTFESADNALLLNGKLQEATASLVKKGGSALENRN